MLSLFSINVPNYLWIVLFIYLFGIFFIFIFYNYLNFYTSKFFIENSFYSFMISFYLSPVTCVKLLSVIRNSLAMVQCIKSGLSLFEVIHVYLMIFFCARSIKLSMTKLRWAMLLTLELTHGYFTDITYTITTVLHIVFRPAL